MKCLVFSTHRRLREYISSVRDTILPQLYTMEAFMERCIVVPQRVFVDDFSRKIYLYRAIEGVDIQKLGFEKDFLSFASDSDFIIRFFREIHSEKVSIEDIGAADTYAEYEEHLGLLFEILKNYKEILDKEGLCDGYILEDYEISDSLIKTLDSIEIYLDGFLSRFELELLRRIDIPVLIHYEATAYNEKVSERLGVEHRIGTAQTVDLHNAGIVSCVQSADKQETLTQTVYLSDKLEQCAFVLERIEYFISTGADPDKIAVILPDENFAEYLRLFDKMRNLNFAMGIPFSQSRYYMRLHDLLESVVAAKPEAAEKTEGSELAKRFREVQNFEDMLKFLQSVERSPQEESVIAETLYRFGRYGRMLQGVEAPRLLYMWLKMLEGLGFDDTGGGRITVMGLLESRGMSFDAVIIPDFNEEIVPRVSQKDIFLDSAVRKRTGMPARADKQNLQRHYYYLLLKKSKTAAISAIENEQSMPSRLLMEFGLADRAERITGYRELILPTAHMPAFRPATVSGPNPFRDNRRLSPTALRDMLVCPRRYYYRHIAKIEPAQSDAADSRSDGILIHAALQAAVENKNNLSDPQQYHRFVMEHIYTNADSKLHRFELSTVWEEPIESFCRKDFDNLGRCKNEVEMWFETQYGGFELTGRVDRVDITSEQIRLIDYKTGKNIKKTMEDERNFQLLFYLLWAQRNYPDRRREAVYIDLYGGKEYILDENSASQSLERFDAILRKLSSEEEISFEMCEEIKECRYCDYAVACGREEERI